MNAKVDRYLSSLEKWQEELETLRMILLDCGLIEELKWGAPCYSYMNSNIAIIGGYKECCALSFFKGVLLVDDQDILSKPGENSQVVRVIRFTTVRDIVKLEPVLKAYIYEAIEVEKAGLRVKLKKNPEPIPVELQNKLDKMPVLKAAFEALTPGRQRAYILYISATKLSKTRDSRVKKCIPQILKGKGINDDYLAGRRDGGKGRKP